MPVKRVNLDEKPIQQKKVTVRTREDLINAALIILRKTQVDVLSSEDNLKDKLSLLNKEFKQKPAHKLLNIVNMWMKGSPFRDDDEEEVKK